MRRFKVNMSHGDPVKIGEDELATVVEALAKRTPAVVCRGGIFNSAFYVSITVDSEAERAAADRRELKAWNGKEFVAAEPEKPDEPFARILGVRIGKEAPQLGKG